MSRRKIVVHNRIYLIYICLMNRIGISPFDYKVLVGNTIPETPLLPMDSC